MSSPPSGDTAEGGISSRFAIIIRICLEPEVRQGEVDHRLIHKSNDPLIIYLFLKNGKRERKGKKKKKNWEHWFEKVKVNRRGRREVAAFALFSLARLGRAT